jgi:transposase
MPQQLTGAEREKLEQLFAQLPRLRELYDRRNRFKEIFDSHCSRRTAKCRLRNLLLEASEAFPALERFLETYLTWEDQILNYFEAYETSAPVEGLNNKARVIIKRAYGLKSAASLWARLVLEVNKVTETATTSIARIRELANGFRCVFSPLCT